MPENHIINNLRDPHLSLLLNQQRNIIDWFCLNSYCTYRMKSNRITLLR